MVVPLPTPQLTVNEGQIAGSPLYSPNLTGGGKRRRRRRRNRTNKKHRSTKRKMRRSKGKRTKQCKCKICKCNPCLCGKSASMERRKNLTDFRASLKKR